MGNTALRTTNLGKQYRIGAKRERYYSLRDAIVSAVKSPLSRLRRLRGDPGGDGGIFWALKEINLEVSKGEAVGIVGLNGAGKSTLLKLLSRVTTPTTGQAELFGRVGSLLEVGTGFHPELTGRENIYLNGCILGMRKAEIDRKFDEIVDFSEVERFLDTPVKHYSSGMYVRLAFSVAAHLDCEILLMDEVLAVGDQAFQKRCLGKMGKVRDEGKTVLFVSHNMTAVQALCERVVLLRSGEAVEDGPAGKVVSSYLSKAVPQLGERVWEDDETAPGNDEIKLRRVAVMYEQSPESCLITTLTPFVMEFEYRNLKPSTRLNLSLVVFNEQGTIIFVTAPEREPAWHGRPFPTGLFKSVCYVPGDLLNTGLHRVTLLVVKNQREVIYTHEDILTFEVVDEPENRKDWRGEWLGAVRPYLEWKTEFLEPF